MTETLFISYSHRDVRAVDELRTHLRPLERRGVITPWTDKYLIPGDEFDSVIRRHLSNARLIALIVSPDFLASDYCFDVEMKEAVTRHEQGSVRIIPIIYRTCQWKTAPFASLQVTPPGGKPVVLWNDIDEAWNHVATDIEAAAKSGTQGVPEAVSSGRSKPGPDRGDMLTTSRRVMPLSVPRTVTDLEKDTFRRDAFNKIAQCFEESVNALGGEVDGRFNRLDTARFTVTVYRAGKRVAACTIWTGGRFFGEDAICYNSNDSGETNSMNSRVAVHADQSGPFLSAETRIYGGGPTGRLTAEEAAEYFWAQLTDRLSPGS